MVIEINKDIDRYQESVALGLSAKQLVFSAVSLIGGAGIVLLLYRYIGLTGSAYVAIPVVAPIALGGFYSYNGMSFYDVMRRKMHMMLGNKALTYVSTEGEAAIRSYRLAEENVLKSATRKRSKGKQVSKQIAIEKKPATDHKEEFDAMKKKMKGMAIGFIIAAVLAAAAAVAYKYFR